MLRFNLLILIALLPLILYGCSEAVDAKQETPKRLSLHDSIINAVKDRVNKSKQCTLRYINKSGYEDEITGEYIDTADTTEITTNTSLILQLLDSFPHINYRTTLTEHIKSNSSWQAQLICDKRVVMDNYWQVYPGQIIINGQTFMSDTCHCSAFIDYPIEK
ncbi:MAG: hypothetical protein ACK5Z2_12390 [Bacteroidota bacterium]|jgi:hypothetical protein